MYVIVYRTIVINEYIDQIMLLFKEIEESIILVDHYLRSLIKESRIRIK